MAKIILDDVDKYLIKVLGQDARISNRKIASDLKVTEGTVRHRIKRLERENIIRFTAVTSVGPSGQVRMAFIRIQADLKRVEEIAANLIHLEEVGSIMITMGKFNLLVIYLFRDLNDLHDLTSETILPMPGVHHIETAITMKTIKTNVRVARIVG